MKRISVLLADLAVAVILTTSGSAQDAVQKGKAAFLKQQCFRCHGTEGQGGAGARLAPNPPQAAALIKYVRKPTGTMPAYCEKCVSDEELTDIRAYLASIPAPKAVNDLPLLNQ
jgi:mono/diheme cytochrome c family protein